MTPKQVRPHLDRCLSCYSCMTTCPSGVDYMHLSDYARQHIEKSTMRAPQDQSKRKLLRNILPYPRRFRLALLRVLASRPFRGILRPLAVAMLSTILDLAPRRQVKERRIHPAPDRKNEEGQARPRDPASGMRPKRAAPRLNDATVRLLNHLGYDVTLPEGEGCCGALTLHMGKEADAKVFAKRNIDAWHAQRGKGGPHRRDHRECVGLRHHGQGLWPSFRGRPRLRREGQICLLACKGHYRVRGRRENGRARGLERYPRRLPFGLLDAARPEDRRGAAPALAQRRASRCSKSRKATSAAARPEPTTCFSRSLRNN